jgi:hypothetical protein
VVPRHLQQWVLIGIALVMVGIMALSGSPVKSRAVSPAPAALAVDPNQQRIEEYQRRIQEQARARRRAGAVAAGERDGGHRP